MRGNVRLLCKKCSKYIFVLCLICSLIGNIVLFMKGFDKHLQLTVGTYQTEINSDATYLLIDGQQNFCRYTQKDGVLNSGTYSLTNSSYYTFNVDDGSTFYMLPSKDVFAFFSKADNEIVFYRKLSSVLVFYDTLSGKWPDWCAKYNVN